jgi:hypothetical protein
MLQGRVDDIYKVLASNSTRMTGILRRNPPKVAARPKKGSSHKKDWLLELQNTNIAIEDEAEIKSNQGIQKSDIGQDQTERKISLDDSCQKELIPLLNLPERNPSSEMTDQLDNSKINTAKPKKTQNSRLESSFYRSESKGDQSIYEKILANIRFTKRSQQETPRSKRQVTYNLFKTPAKDDSRHSEGSLKASSGLRSKHTFAQSRDGLIIYDSDQALAPETSPGTDINRKFYCSSQSQLTSDLKAAYVYSRSVKRSYSNLFDRRKQLARSCSQL